MTSILRTSFMLAVVLSSSVVTFAQSTDARVELDAGVQAYKNAKYEEAIQHFKNATLLDEQFINAHLYLATAEAQMYIPGVETSENKSYAQAAIVEYGKVLELDSKSMNSVKGIAYLYLQMHEFDKAKQYYQKATDLDPNDPENYYSIGVIDWTESYQKRMDMRGKENLKPEQPFINSPNCEELHNANQDVIKDGMDMLVKSLQLRPDYDDAMAYMNLMYREKADIDCGDRTEYKSDIESADHWVDLTMTTKKMRSKATPETGHTDTVPQ